MMKMSESEPAVTVSLACHSMIGELRTDPRSIAQRARGETTDNLRAVIGKSSHFNHDLLCPFRQLVGTLAERWS